MREACHMGVPCKHRVQEGCDLLDHCHWEPVTNNNLIGVATIGARMKIESKAKIVEALRSGRYKQGEEYLRIGDCYCVWGVICDVSGLYEWRRYLNSQQFSYGYECMAPDAKVLQWAGISECSEVVINGIKATLMQHNDNGATFKQLAHAIESQL